METPLYYHTKGLVGTWRGVDNSVDPAAVHDSPKRSILQNQF